MDVDGCGWMWMGVDVWMGVAVVWMAVDGCGGVWIGNDCSAECG